MRRRQRRLRDLVEIPVDRLRNIGEKRTAALGSMGIENIFDLLTWYPRRYIDRTKRVDLSDLTVGEEAAVFGEITRIKGRRIKSGKVMVEANVSDDSGSFKVVFFNQGWRESQLPVGVQALFFGKVTDYKGQRQMTNPVVDVIVGASGDERDASRIGRVVPIYPASGKAGLTSWEVGGFIDESLRRTGAMLDPVPESARLELDLIDRTAPSRGSTCPRSGASRTSRDVAWSSMSSCDCSSSSRCDVDGWNGPRPAFVTRSTKRTSTSGRARWPTSPRRWSVGSSSLTTSP